MIKETALGRAPLTKEESVLKNTYMLLGMNFMTSAAAAYASMSMNSTMMPVLMWLAIYFVLIYGVEKTADSAYGLPMTFVFTGFLGFTLGPILNAILTIESGTDIILNALGSTAILFVVLSVWTVKARVKMSQFGSFLAVGMLSAFLMSLMNIFIFESSLISMVLSTVVMFLAGGIIMFQTSEIIYGGEKNYIRATVTLFVQIFNLFQVMLFFFIPGGKD
ncbi:Bax inhibitor-1 family protein [Vibrio splendidus]|nr:Bax inhibitor-1 family protein [Vibrio splendidus]MCC4881552.1 Bax inhibitor-1 family protein [Vibrio splendidus]